MCKTDNYLTLCLEQAAKSPLHYRHGCIVVRGGKVVGQGYNDYRPGFNGGALKHGRIAKGALDGPALAELKEKLKKNKPKEKQQQQQQQSQPGNSNTFVPFEGTGGGHHTNTPLSMHSEMMAIHSALAASSTLSSTSFACEKPCFKLPRSDKRKARLRAEVLKRYVEVVCDTATTTASTTSAGTGTAKQGSGKLQVVHHVTHNHNNNKQEDLDKEDGEEAEVERRVRALRRHAQQSGVQHVLKECRRAFHVPPSGGKHHHHQKRKGKEGKKNGKEGQYGYQYEGQYGGQIQESHGRQQQQGQPSVSKRGKASDDDEDDEVAKRYESTVHDVMTEMAKEACAEAQTHGKSKKDYKRSGKMRPQNEPLQPEPMLLPKGQTGPSLADRKKHPRLLGADLYVARLGWCKAGPNDRLPTVPAPAPSPAPPIPETSDPTSLESSTCSLSLASSTTTSTTISCPISLHDELTHTPRTPSFPTTNTTHTTGPRTLDPSIIRASRPCYRCIAYMSSVGIKRVFWTNDAGQWEGGKVRDLVGALESSMDAVAGEKGMGTGKEKGREREGGGVGVGVGGGPTGNGVFVTKHEVLMLRRMMGEGSR